MSFFRRAGALIARFFTSAADPAAVAGEFPLYSKVDGGGVSQLFGRSDNGAVHQISPPAVGGSQGLIFKPGSGAAGPVVFDTWAALYARLTTLRSQANGSGIYTIQFDTSVASPCVVPAGAYDMTDVTWEGIDVAFFPKTPVTLADGVVLTGMRRFRHLAILNTGLSSPITDFNPLIYNSMFLEATDFATGGLPMVVITNSVFDLRLAANSHLDGPPVVSVQGTSSGNIWVGEVSFVNSDSLESGVGVSIALNVTASSGEANAIQPAVSVGTLGITNETAYRQFPTQIYTGASSPILSALQEMVQIDRDAGAIEVRLPSIPADGVTRGQSVIVKAVTASVVGAVSVVSDGADTIDGAASYAFPATARHAVTFVSDGVSNWNIVAAYP